MINKIIILLIIIGSSFSQVLSDYSFNSAESCSMAGAIVSNKGGNSSLYNNPAGLSEIKDTRISIGYSHLYNQNYLPLTSLGIIRSTSFMNVGLKYTSFKVDYGNTSLLNENLLGLVAGFYLLNDKNSTLSLGFSANYYLIQFGSSSGVSGDGSDGVEIKPTSGFGLDIGFLATLRDKNRIGIFIKNINSPLIGRGMSEQNLPRKIDIGFSTIPYDPLIISFGMEQLLGYQDPQFKTSIKYQLNKILCLNTGIQINPNRFGMGFIIKKSSISLSYGYLTHHVLPGTHQFNMEYGF